MSWLKAKERGRNGTAEFNAIQTGNTKSKKPGQVSPSGLFVEPVAA
jgi:hypothetical protein